MLFSFIDGFNVQAMVYVIALLMLVRLPESPQFLAQKQQARERAARVPLTQLFHDGRAPGTALLWTANFMNLLNLYFLSSWLPTVVHDAGHPTVIGVYAGTALQVGGTLGSILLGWLVNRYGFVAVLTPCLRWHRSTSRRLECRGFRWPCFSLSSSSQERA